MANPNIRVDVDGNTAKLRRQIDDIAKTPIVLDVRSAGAAAAPLGRITGQVAELDKSLAAANARVVAFAASASAIYGIQAAVKAVFDSFVNVEKKLTDINVLLNASSASIAKFGSALFDIAGNTAQSFDVVAEAATELARQGLGVEETLKRTEAALVLTRLSGLDAAASVSALTSAINSFGTSALEAEEIVNKLANVDAAFAVSSADLANALSRVGSSASDAGVSFDELIALVTTAQQVTARGGSVIGNSLKTIFTRLGREKVQDVLGGLGVSPTDEQGNVKNQVQLLKELASIYDTLSATQKNYVAEQVGGVFQINVLKAALGDLGKEYSIYDQALKTSLSSTDEAIRRNEKLNETLSARGLKTLAGLQEAGANVGSQLFGPATKNVLNITDLITGAVNDTDSSSVGAKIGRGVVSGIGNFIGGPGLALVTAAIVKMFAQFSKYGVEAFRSILGVNQASKEQAAIQQSVIKFLQSNAGVYKSIVAGQTSATSAANAYLNVIKMQTAELQKQGTVAAQVAKAVSSQVGIQSVAGKQYITQKGAKIKGAAGGYLPPEQFSEAANIGNRVGGANPRTDKPVTIKNFPFGGGKKGPITAHTGEWAVPNYGGGDGTAIWNREMKQKYGLPDGARKISASGYIPNFAQPQETKSFPGGVISGRQSSQVANANLDMHSAFSFDVVSIGSKAGFEKQFDKQLNNLNSEDPKLAGAASKYFTRNGYSLSQVDQLKQNLLTSKKKVPSLLADNKDYVSKSGQLSGVKNSLLGKYFERFAANRLGLQIAQKQNARMDLLDKSGKPAAEVKFGRIDKDNLISKVIETNYQKTLKQDPPAFDNIKMPSNYKLVVPNAASGYIPNFAGTPKQNEEIIDLGDTRTSKLLNGKVLSLIHPGVSDGFDMAPGVGTYLGKKYKGTIPVAGINKNMLKGQLPDLQKNLGDLLVREANQFGQILGGKNFLKSPKDLPNYGAAEGAVGVAFEGGLITLLQQGLQKTSQNAGIDFRQNRITPRLRNLFHGAPGMYDAKSSPGAVNEVMQKLLNEAKPGAVKRVRSGPSFNEVQALRAKAIQSINAEGLNLRRGPQLEKEIEKRMAQFKTSGAASGYIPSFAPNISAIQELMKRGATQGERMAAQAALTRIQSSALLKLGTPDKLSKFRELLYGSKSNAGFNLDAIRIGDLKYKPLTENAKLLGLSDKDLQILASNPAAVQQLRTYTQNFKQRSESFASGYVPNFATSDEYAKNVLALEESVSGEKAIVGTKPFLHIRNKSQPSFASAMRDHGGKNKAMKDSADMQKGAGLLASSGFIPNFATTDAGSDIYDSGGTDLTAITASVSSLLFALAFFGGALEDSTRSLSKLKTEVAKSGKSLDDFDLQNRDRISRQDRQLNKINQQEQIAMQNRALFNQESQTWTKAGEKGAAQRENRRAQIQAAQERSQQRQETIGLARERAKETRSEKFGRFAADKGLAAGFTIQALSGVVSEFAGGQKTKVGAASTAIGNVASFGLSGAMIGAQFAGKGAIPGAIIGGLIGAAISAKPTLDALTTSIIDLENAAQKSAESAQIASDNVQAVLVSRQSYDDILNDPQSSPEKIARANQKYLSDLGKLPKEYVQKYLQAPDSAAAQEVLAQYAQDSTDKAEIDALTADLEKAMNASFSTPSKKEAESLAKRLIASYDIGGEGSAAKTVEQQAETFTNLEKSVNDALAKVNTYGNNLVFNPDTGRNVFAGEQAMKNVLDEFESQIDGSTAEGKLLKERVAEIRERFQEMDPDTADYQALLQALSKELAGAKESAQKIKEAMDLRAKNVSKLSKEDQDYINNFQKNEKKFNQQAELTGNLNKIKRINMQQLGLDLSQGLEAAMMQNRDFTTDEQLEYRNVNIDFSKKVKTLQISSETLDTVREKILEKLDEQIKLAQADTSPDPALLKKLQGLKEKVLSAVTLGDIESIDLDQLLGEAGESLKRVWDVSLQDGLQSFKLAMQNLNFETEAEKVKAAFDLAVSQFTERIQKMQSFGGGVEGLINYSGNRMPDISRSIQEVYRSFENINLQVQQSDRNYNKSKRNISEEKEDLQAAYDFGDIGPRDYNRQMKDIRDEEVNLEEQRRTELENAARERERLQREMQDLQKEARKEEMNMSLERLKAVDALGIKDPALREGLMQQLLPDLQKQAQYYLDQIGLSPYLNQMGLGNIGAQNAEDMLRSMFGLQTSDQKWKNPFNQAAEDAAKKAADLSEKFSDIVSKIDPLAESATNASDSLNNLRESAAKLNSALGGKDDKKDDDKKDDGKKDEDKPKDDKPKDDKPEDDRIKKDEKGKAEKDKKDSDSECACSDEFGYVRDEISNLGDLIGQKIKELGETICSCITSCCPGYQWSGGSAGNGPWDIVAPGAGGAGGGGMYGGFNSNGGVNWGFNFNTGFAGGTAGGGTGGTGGGGSSNRSANPSQIVPPNLQRNDSFWNIIDQLKENWPSADFNLDDVFGGLIKMPDGNQIMVNPDGKVGGLVGEDPGRSSLDDFVKEKYLNKTETGALPQKVAATDNQGEAVPKSGPKPISQEERAKRESLTDADNEWRRSQGNFDTRSEDEIREITEIYKQQRDKMGPDLEAQTEWSMDTAAKMYDNFVKPKNNQGFRLAPYGRYRTSKEASRENPFSSGMETIIPKIAEKDFEKGIEFLEGKRLYEDGSKQIPFSEPNQYLPDSSMVFRPQNSFDGMRANSTPVIPSMLEGSGFSEMVTEKERVQLLNGLNAAFSGDLQTSGNDPMSNIFNYLASQTKAGVAEPIIKEQIAKGENQNILSKDMPKDIPFNYEQTSTTKMDPRSVSELAQEQKDVWDALMYGFSKYQKPPSGGDEPKVLPSTFREGMNSLLGLGYNNPSQLKELTLGLRDAYAFQFDTPPNAIDFNRPTDVGQSVIDKYKLTQPNELKYDPEALKTAQALLANAPKRRVSYDTGIATGLPERLGDNFEIGSLATKDIGYLGEPGEYWLNNQDYALKILRNLAYPNQVQANDQKNAGTLNEVAKNFTRSAGAQNINKPADIPRPWADWTKKQTEERPDLVMGMMNTEINKLLESGNFPGAITEMESALNNKALTGTGSQFYATMLKPFVSKISGSGYADQAKSLMDDFYEIEKGNGREFFRGEYGTGSIVYPDGSSVTTPYVNDFLDKKGEIDRLAELQPERKPDILKPNMVARQILDSANYNKDFGVSPVEAAASPQLDMFRYLEAYAKEKGAVPFEERGRVFKDLGMDPGIFRQLPAEKDVQEAIAKQNAIAAEDRMLYDANEAAKNNAKAYLPALDWQSPEKSSQLPTQNVIGGVTDPFLNTLMGIESQIPNDLQQFVPSNSDYRMEGDLEGPVPIEPLNLKDAPPKVYPLSAPPSLFQEPLKEFNLPQNELEGGLNKLSAADSKQYLKKVPNAESLKGLIANNFGELEGRNNQLQSPILGSLLPIPQLGDREMQVAQALGESAATSSVPSTVSALAATGKLFGLNTSSIKAPTKSFGDVGYKDWAKYYKNRNRNAIDIDQPFTYKTKEYPDGKPTWAEKPAFPRKPFSRTPQLFGYGPLDTQGGFYGQYSPDQGRIGINTQAVEPFSEQDFATRRHEVGHMMRRDPMGQGLFKGTAGRYFGKDRAIFGPYNAIIDETQARAVEKRSGLKGTADMMRNTDYYAEQAEKRAQDPRFSEETRKDQGKIAQGYRKLGKVGKFGDGIVPDSLDALDDAIRPVAKEITNFGRGVMAGGSATLSDVGKATLGDLKSIPSMLTNPKALLGAGKNIAKGGLIGAGVDAAAEIAIPKSDSGSYLGDVYNELRSSAISIGGGATAGAVGGGGVGAVPGAVAGGVLDLADKFYRGGSDLIELGKVTYDNYQTEKRTEQMMKDFESRGAMGAQPANQLADPMSSTVSLASPITEGMPFNNLAIQPLPQGVPGMQTLPGSLTPPPQGMPLLQTLPGALTPPPQGMPGIQNMGGFGMPPMPIQPFGMPAQQQPLGMPMGMGAPQPFAQPFGMPQNMGMPPFYGGMPLQPMGMPQPFNMPQFQGMGPANQMPPIANQQTQQPILNDSSKQQKSIFENQKLNLNNMPNISDTKNEMTKLVSSLDKASTSVEKQSEASRTNTESLQSTREAFQGFEDSSESQEGAGSAGTPPANVTMPITANFTPTLSVKMAEDALSTLQSSQAEMNEGLRSELRSAIDQVNRRIADMRTQSAQKN